MKLIVGLGNPGAKYAGTRHNAGRWLIEYAASHQGISFTKKKSLLASIVSLEWEDQPVVLAYPETWMNQSGDAVKALVQHFEVDPKKDLLVIVDDLALPLGRIRFRASGSDGGHNGLKSVQAALQTEGYARLRIGIGPLNPMLSYEEFVLERFKTSQQKLLKKIFQECLSACKIWAGQSSQAAMNAVNSVFIEG
ncbi:MAG: aminoacyl-tRNA hydrolase [Candidatus Omnitrophica bacterium]|nr:aminoacyl-tRNA hydrolase [Candidatus Omnitrophota bacterium]